MHGYSQTRHCNSCERCCSRIFQRSQAGHVPKRLLGSHVQRSRCICMKILMAVSVTGALCDRAMGVRLVGMEVLRDYSGVQPMPPRGGCPTDLIGSSVIPSRCNVFTM